MTKRSAGRDLALIPEEFQEIATLCAATDVLIGGRTVIGVPDARQLHAGLGVGRDFTTWIEGRISKYGFRAGVDFEVSQSPNRGTGAQKHTGGSPTKEYRLALDMAKELAMVENNEMGRLIRRYYIWLEDQQSAPVADELTRRIDGIARTTVHKVTAIEKVVTLMATALEERDREIAELTDIVKGLVKCADGRLAAIDAVPALQIAIDAKVPVSGRRPIVRAISNSLARHCAERGHIVRRDVRGTKLYPLTAAHEWRLSGGDHLIRKLVAANTSAGPLFAIPGGKSA